MTFVCLWIRASATAGVPPLAELAPLLLADAPRVASEQRGVLWADGRGLPERELAETLLGRLDDAGIRDARAGVAGVPVAAELAARSGDAAVTVVPAGGERTLLAPLALALLEPEPRLLNLLHGVGVRTCGELASLDRGSVETRFGAAGARLWRLARADDPRLLFAPIPRERPHASLDFVDHEVRSAAGLVFALNALLESVCATLAGRGELLRALTLRLALADRTVWERTLRAAHPTSEHARWLRRLRELLDRLALPDGVTGVALHAAASEPASAFSTQGDIFDRGFATATAAADAVGRLADRHGPVFVVPEVSSDPLVERRTRWTDQDPGEVVRPASGAEPPGPACEPALQLQLLPEPRRIAVRTEPRRDHLLPIRYRDREGWHTLVGVAGPHRVSGGRWESFPYAREYFRCVTDAGALVWLFRDAVGSGWYLHGWWD